MNDLFKGGSVFIVLLLSTKLIAQNPHSYFGEVELEVEIPTQSKFSFEVETSARGLFLETYDGEQSSEYEPQHFEITQVTKYQYSETSEFAIGLRYRWKETFDDDEVDEHERHIDQLGIGVLHRHRARLQCHPTDRTIPRISLHNLRVHRTGIFRASTRRCHIGRLQCHATLGAGSRFGLKNLRVHRTDIVGHATG